MNNIFIPNLYVTLSGKEEAMSPFTYELSTNRTIYLFGEVNCSSANMIISQLNTLDSISDQDITLRINSPGGSVSDGFAIVDTMDLIRSSVKTECVGLAASMAAIILASGEKGKRYITQSSEVMIHQPLGGAQGQASEISRMCEHIIKTKENIANHLSSQTGKNVKDILKDMDRDFWMCPSQAKEYGIVDHILGKGKQS